MARNLPVAILGVIVLLWVGVNQVAFIVNPGQMALVVRLGNPIKSLDAEGLYFKLPVVDSVIFYSRRLLNYETKDKSVITLDKKTLSVSNYTKWRITDPKQFFQTVRSIPEAQTRIDNIVYSALNAEISKHELNKIVSDSRDIVRTDVIEQCRVRTQGGKSDFGFEIVDVRIKSADLPKDNEEAVFNRMKAERAKVATKYRSEGKSDAQKIVVSAEKTRTRLLAEAQADAERTMGDADSASIQIFARAFSRDPEFYSFYRTLEAYKEVFDQGSSTFVLSPQTEFLRYLRQDAPNKPPVPRPAKKLPEDLKEAARTVPMPVPAPTPDPTPAPSTVSPTAVPTPESPVRTGN